SSSFSCDGDQKAKLYRQAPSYMGRVQRARRKHMNRRDQIRMTDEEIRAFLEEQRTLQVATIDHDGYPHLVAMWYILINDEIVFWTYAKSQKAANLRRDNKLTCLVEAGEQYNELRGVQIKGH